MTYAAKELGVASGAPVELYEFLRSVGGAIQGNVVLQKNWGDYANSAAMLADSTETGDTENLVTWDLDATHIRTSPTALHLLLTVTPLTFPYIVTRSFTVSGLTPSTTYTQRADVYNHGSGFAGFFPDQWHSESRSVVTNGSGVGTLEFRINIVAGTPGAPVDPQERWFDNVRLIAPAGSAPATPAAVYLTSLDADYTFATHTYVQTQLVRSTVQRGGLDSGPGELEITVPRDHEVAGWVVGGLPSSPITCTVRRTHRGETEAIVLAYKWRVSQARFEGTTCTLTLASLRSEFQRKLPKYATQTTCPWALYGTLCQADEASHTFAGTVTSVDGLTAVVSGVASASNGLTDPTLFEGGVIVTPSGVRVGIRTVTLAANGTATDSIILSRPHGLVATDAVFLIAGCDKTPQICHTRFTNTEHFGGEPMMPARSPFSGAGLSDTP